MSYDHVLSCARLRCGVAYAQRIFSEILVGGPQRPPHIFARCVARRARTVDLFSPRTFYQF